MFSEQVDQSAQGLVAQRIKKIDGVEGVARLDRRVLAVKEETTTAPASSIVQTTTLRPTKIAQVTTSQTTTTSEPGQLYSQIKQELTTPQQVKQEQHDNKDDSEVIFSTPRETCKQDESGDLLMTPRGGPVSAPAARPALRLSCPDQRRNSRVSFAKDFGLDLEEDSEVDMGLDSDAEDLVVPPDTSVISTFALDDSDESGSDCDLDDEYDFDHDKLVELVKTGADRLQLASVVEDAMASALERKLARKAGKEPRDISALAAEAAAQNTEEWDLDGHMTPPEGPAADASVNMDEVAERAQEAIALANARRRRSSAARKQLPHIQLVMEAAMERRRKSLAKKFDGCSDAQDKIAAAMENARGRHRQSMSKAADILESAGYDEDSVPCNEAAAKMKLVQQAMEDARLRHRRSIARAVQNLDAPPALIKPTLNAEAQEYNPCGAHANAMTEQPQQMAWHQTATGVCSPDASWGMEGWNCTSSSMQNRINDAVSSAYSTHCYQQGYADQDYSQYGASNQLGYQQSQNPYEQQQSYGTMPQNMQQGYGPEMGQQSYQQDMTYGQQSGNHGYAQGFQQQTSYEDMQNASFGGQQSCQQSYQQDATYGQQQAYGQHDAYGQQSYSQQAHCQQGMCGTQSWSQGY